MIDKANFEQFLQENHIHYDIPIKLLHKIDIFESMLSICKNLIAAKPSLLYSGNLKNLDTLMEVAQDPFYVNGPINSGPFISTKPFNFQTAIHRLSTENPSVLNQDTFDGLCRIISKIHGNDIDIVATCFISLEKAHLLTRKNIQQLGENIIHAPLRQFFERSRAAELNDWLSSCPWLTQDDFSLMMQNKISVNLLSLCMQQLYKKGLNSPANYQALADGNISMSHISTQEAFNASILAICDEKLRELGLHITAIGNLKDIDAAKLIHKQASVLYKQLCEMRNTPETQADPRNFLHALVIIHHALPSQNNPPTKAALDELMELGDVFKKNHSPLWHVIGAAMMLLGAAITIVAVTAITLSIVGIITMPAGLGLVALCTVSALTDFGIFAYSKSKIEISNNINGLAETLLTTTAI